MTKQMCLCFLPPYLAKCLAFSGNLNKYFKNGKGLIFVRTFHARSQDEQSILSPLGVNDQNCSSHDSYFNGLPVQNSGCFPLGKMFIRTGIFSLRSPRKFSVKNLI